MIFFLFSVHAPALDPKKRVVNQGAKSPIAQSLREVSYKIDWPNDDVARMHLHVLDCGVSATRFEIFAEESGD